MASETDAVPGAQALELTPTAVAQLLESEPAALLVDVREAHERTQAHIAGSAHIPLSELSGRAPELPSETRLIFYCQVGVRSLLAAEAFRASGYDAYTMGGGIVRWAREGLPVAPEGATPLSD